MMPELSYDQSRAMKFAETNTKALKNRVEKELPSNGNKAEYINNQFGKAMSALKDKKTILNSIPKENPFYVRAQELMTLIDDLSNGKDTTLTKPNPVIENRQEHVVSPKVEIKSSSKQDIDSLRNNFHSLIKNNTERIKEVSSKLYELIKKDPQAATELLLKNKETTLTAEAEEKAMKKLTPQEKQQYVEYLDTLIANNTYSGYEKIFIGLIKRFLIKENQGKNRNSTFMKWTDMKSTTISLNSLTPFDKEKGVSQALTRKDLNVLFPAVGSPELGNLLSGKGSYIDGQGNVGDCYLISAINGIRKHPQFFSIMQKSLQKTQDGFILKLPLGEPKGKDISITYQELAHAGAKGAGYKIFEIAYTKYVTGLSNITSLDDVKRITGGNAGNAIDTLLGKGNVEKVVEENRSPASKEATNKLLVALRDEKNGIKLSSAQKKSILQEIDQSTALFSRKEQVENILSKVDMSKDIITGSSLSGFTDTSSKIEIDKNRLVARKHAYMIENVIKDKNTGRIDRIIVANPWNARGKGSNTMPLTLDEFCKSFKQLVVSRPKDKWGDNKSNLDELVRTDYRK